MVSSNKEEAAAIPPSLEVPTSDIILDEDFTTAILCWLCKTPGCPYWTSYERWWKGVCVRCRPLVSLWRIHPCSRVRGSRSPFWFLILDISHFFAVLAILLAPVLSALLQAHASQPFQSLSNVLSFTAYSSLLFSFRHHLSHYLIFGRVTSSLAAAANGVCVSLEWIANHGVRNVFLTSCCGLHGLMKVDNLYIHYLHSKGVHVEVIVVDVVSKEKTAVVIEHVKKADPIGGVFIMTVVLLDAKFTNLTHNNHLTTYTGLRLRFSTPCSVALSLLPLISSFSFPLLGLCLAMLAKRRTAHLDCK